MNPLVLAYYQDGLASGVRLGRLAVHVTGGVLVRVDHCHAAMNDAVLRAYRAARSELRTETLCGE